MRKSVRRLMTLALCGAVLSPLAACQTASLPMFGREAKAPPPSQNPAPAFPATVRIPEIVQNAQSRIPLEALLGQDNSQPTGPMLRPPVSPDGKVRVGLLLPLSGMNQAVGQSMLNAAQMALFDFSGGKFELLVHDTKGSSEGAAQAAAVAIGEGASMLLGPLLADSVQAVSPTAAQMGLNVLAFSNNASAASANSFILGFRPAEEVERVIAHAAKQGITKFAILGPDDAYGRMVEQAFNKAVADRGGQITDSVFYQPYSEDFNDIVRDLANYDMRRQELLRQRKQLEAKGDEISLSALKRLENLQTIGDVPFEALLIADGGKRLQSVAALLPYYDIDPRKVRILGTSLWDVPGIGAEPALLGAWYSAPDPTARQNFEEKYRSLYGKPPARIATLAYDAVALSAVLAQGEGGPHYTVDYLTARSGFEGRDGIFRLFPDGLNQRGLAVLQVGARSNKVISAAPRSFEEPIN